MRARFIKFIIIITIITIIFSRDSVFAAAPTPTPADSVASPSAAALKDKLKQIEVLKEKIATKVAELRQNEKAAVSGIVKSVGETTITITAKSGDKTISFSDDTIFFQMKDGIRGDPQDAKQAAKLKGGDAIAALGYLDSSNSTFMAKYVYTYAQSLSLHLIGKIADMDKANYTITVKSPEGDTLVDIETYTKIFTYAAKTGLAKSGFSKLNENDIVHIYATPNAKEANRVSALKIVSLTFGSQTSSSSATPTKGASASATPTEK